MLLLHWMLHLRFFHIYNLLNCYQCKYCIWRETTQGLCLWFHINYRHRASKQFEPFVKTVDIFKSYYAFWVFASSKCRQNTALSQC